MAVHGGHHLDSAAVVVPLDLPLWRTAQGSWRPADASTMAPSPAKSRSGPAMARRCEAEANPTARGGVWPWRTRGLTNEELRLCHRVLSLHSGAIYPSLNLSHAVGVVLHDLARLQLKPVTNGAANRIPAPPAQLTGLIDDAADLLLSCGLSAAPHPRCTNGEGPRSAATRHPADPRKSPCCAGWSVNCGGRWEPNAPNLPTFGFEALVQQPFHPTSPWLGRSGSSAVRLLVDHGCGAWSITGSTLRWLAPEVRRQSLPPPAGWIKLEAARRFRQQHQPRRRRASERFNPDRSRRRFSPRARSRRCRQRWRAMAAQQKRSAGQRLSC